jgi:hypothetical protein
MIYFQIYHVPLNGVESKEIDQCGGLSFLKFSLHVASYAMHTFKVAEEKLLQRAKGYNRH